MNLSKEQLLETFTCELTKKNKLRVLSFVPFAIAFLWVLLLFISPLTQPPGTIYLGNDGKVSIMDNSDYINSHIENPVARAVYLSGDFMCHQHADRSFFINGNQMPYCARCTGIFLGLAFGALIGTIYRTRIGFGLYLLTIVPLGIDGVLQLLTPYESTNLIRILTGTLVGTFTSIVFASVYYDTH